MNDPWKSRLEQITTQWNYVHDANHFVMHYAPAIRRYLDGILRGRSGNDADDVLQDFLLKIVKEPFPRVTPDRGRFRDYVKTAVRNAALAHLRRKRPASLADADNDIPEPAGEDVWTSEWRRCIVDGAFRELERRQHRSPDNLHHAVLRATLDHPDEDSSQLADRVASAVGRPLRAEAFRQQLSRARRALAEAIVDEVARTVQRPTPQQLEEELVELGLLDHVKPYLPDTAVEP